MFKVVQYDIRLLVFPFVLHYPYVAIFYLDCLRKSFCGFEQIYWLFKDDFSKIVLDFYV